MKIFTAALFVAGFLIGLTVFAYGDNVGETIGYVSDIHGEVICIEGEPLTEHGFSDVFIRLGNAPVYDLLTGFRVCSEDIFPDTDIRAAYTITRNEPFPAVVVWLNWDNEHAAAFTVTASENINTGSDETVFLCKNGKYCVVIAPETIIIDPHYGTLSHEDITSGMEFFVWVDMITASTPALVYPDKVVVVY
jgi:hypothetical protein